MLSHNDKIRHAEKLGVKHKNTRNKSHLNTDNDYEMNTTMLNSINQEMAIEHGKLDSMNLTKSQI